MANINCWYRYTIGNLPPKNERVLISDGDVVAIARRLENDDKDVWIFDNQNFTDIQITWWQALPEKPPIVRNLE